MGEGRSFLPSIFVFGFLLFVLFALLCFASLSFRLTRPRLCLVLCRNLSPECWGCWSGARLRSCDKYLPFDSAASNAWHRRPKS